MSLTFDFSLVTMEDRQGNKILECSKYIYVHKLSYYLRIRVKSK